MIRQHLFAAALFLLPAVAEAEAPRELWAGHQIVTGARKVPLLGDVKTRTDSFFLAQVERKADGSVKLTQQTCRVAIAPAAGVQVTFAPGTEPKLPVSTIELRKNGELYSASFVSGWDETDVDGDGKPGATMLVDAPVCDGRIFVRSHARTQLRGKAKDGAIAGEARAVSDQKTLDADGACLKMMATDERDSVRGTFAYVPVPAGSTCESLLAAAKWPAVASEPRVEKRR